MTLKKLKLMGKKRGMMQYFDDKGHAFACTVIEVQPNVITQIKTKENDGYSAIQVGFDKLKVKDARTIAKRVTKPRIGHFKKAGVEPCRYLNESPLDSTDSYQVGQELTIADFGDISYVDVTGQSKGKGFQGVIKRHNFAGGPASHGSGFHRHGGSTGMRTSPGRCLPGQKMPGHMGDERVTVQTLKVIAVDLDQNVLIVEGAVPGPRDGLVYVTNAEKHINSKKSKKS